MPYEFESSIRARLIIYKVYRDEYYLSNSG